MNYAVKQLPPGLPVRITVSSEGHWLWGGARTPDGYGRTRWLGESTYTHRLVYTLLVGPIPDGLEIDHLCRVTSCCNPAHLEPVTGAENKRRGNSPAGIAARRNTCARGHAYADGTFIIRRGRRECIECRRITARSRWVHKGRADVSGERNPAAILDVEQVREIKRTSGLSYSQIAARFGVSKSTIAAIKAGRIWSDVA